MIIVIIIIRYSVQQVASLICRECIDYYTMQLHLDKATIGM